MVKINAKHVNPFVEAAMRVVTQITGIEVRRGHLSYKEKAEPSFGVSIIIGIYGFLTGQIVYSLDGQLAERLVDKMLEGKSPQEKKIMFLDCLGEVANMITGNATSLLNQRRDQIPEHHHPGHRVRHQPQRAPGTEARAGAGADHAVRAHRDQHRGGREGDPAGSGLVGRRAPFRDLTPVPAAKMETSLWK